MNMKEYIIPEIIKKEKRVFWFLCLIGRWHYTAHYPHQV